MNSTKTIEVVAAIFESEGKFLIAQRPYDKSLGGYWEFPGGKVQVGEDLVSGLKREILEELSVKIDVNSHLITVEHDYESFKIKLHAFLVTADVREFQFTEHIDHHWAPLHNLKKFQLAPADVPVVEELIKKAG